MSRTTKPSEQALLESVREAWPDLVEAIAAVELVLVHLKAGVDIEEVKGVK